MNLVKYEVGQPFPFPHPMPGMDITLADITMSLFDIKCYISNPTTDEIKDWRKGELWYGLYQYDSCPIFLIKFKNWNLDVNINILKIKTEEQQTKWLNEQGNIINFFLIDAVSNILKAMRTISIPLELSDHIRDTLEKQSEKYKSVVDVEKRIAEIQHTITTDDMIRRTKMFKL